MIRRALISVSDKRGVVELGRALAAHGVQILSTGGTAQALAAAGVPVTQVSTYTGAPEILDGRVKTLHPKIHGGLLGRATPEHQREMAEQGIEAIDLVIVNLYPFEATIAKPTTTLDEAIENIDIGGPSMLRSAAKNHERVTVVVDPDDYPIVAAALRDGDVSAGQRLALARKAFSHTAAYDAAIAAYLSSIDDGAAHARHQAPSRRELPDTLTIQWRRLYELRYGENPHQGAAFYADARSPLERTTSTRPTIATAEVLGGKQLSYNNILDLDAALGLCLELAEPAAVVVKHNNPCGVALGADVASAYRRARDADATSAFGGIVAVNREVDAALAALLVETFLECVVGAGLLRRRARAARGQEEPPPGRRHRGLAGADGRAGVEHPVDRRRRPGPERRQWHGRAGEPPGSPPGAPRPTPSAAICAFAWRVAKHVKSNAIVFAKDGVTVAIGAGQMSRVDSVRICERKAGDALRGAVVASDAFFPFRDGVDVLAAAGAVAVVQPGGSVRDDEVIGAANEHGLAMLFTGMRHFRH